MEKQRWSWKHAVIVMALGTPIVYGVGLLIGHTIAADMRTRLELRWPMLMDMPARERKAIVESAVACDLMRHSEPTSGSVESCVREGANKMGHRLAD